MEFVEAFGDFGQFDMGDDFQLLASECDDDWPVRCRALTFCEEEQAEAAEAAPEQGPEDAKALARCGQFHYHTSANDECELCTPCPEPSSWADFCLIGDSGKKNGAKILRKLVCASDLWRDLSKRRKAAEAASSRGHHKTARALNAGRSADLQKEELLTISHLWSVRSNLWQPREERPLVPTGKRAAAATSSGTAAEGEASDSAARDATDDDRDVHSAAAKRKRLTSETSTVVIRRESSNADFSAAAYAACGTSAPPPPAAAGPEVFTAPILDAPPASSDLAAVRRSSVAAGGFDQVAIVYALKQAIVPKVHAIEQKIVAWHMQAPHAIGSLLGKGAADTSGNFLSEDLLRGLKESVATMTETLVPALTDIRTRAALRLLTAQANASSASSVVGAFPACELQQERVWLDESPDGDLYSEAFYRSWRESLVVARDALLTKVAARALQQQPASAAQAAWEDGILCNFVAAIDALSAALATLPLARQHLNPAIRCTTYLHVAEAVAEAMLGFVTRVAAANLASARWVEEVLQRRPSTPPILAQSVFWPLRMVSQ